MIDYWWVDYNSLLDYLIGSMVLFNLIKYWNIKQLTSKLALSTQHTPTVSTLSNRQGKQVKQSHNWSYKPDL